MKTYILLAFLIITILFIVQYTFNANTTTYSIFPHNYPRYHHKYDGFSNQATNIDIPDKLIEYQNQIIKNQLENRQKYITNIENTNIIESNPWIMINDMSQQATTYPRYALDSLTGDNTNQLTLDPRSYYEFSDVTYLGLPL